MIGHHHPLAVLAEVKEWVSEAKKGRAVVAQGLVSTQGLFSRARRLQSRLIARRADRERGWGLRPYLIASGQDELKFARTPGWPGVPASSESSTDFSHTPRCARQRLRALGSGATMLAYHSGIKPP